MMFCSQHHNSGGYDQHGGDDSRLAESVHDRIKHDAYKIHIIPTDPINYRSMREVCGLDKSLASKACAWPLLDGAVSARQPGSYEYVPALANGSQTAGLTVSRRFRCTSATFTAFLRCRHGGIAQRSRSRAPAWPCVWQRAAETTD